MQQIIDDAVFGKLDYRNNRARKKERITFWGVNHDIEIVVVAYAEDEINDIQRDNYRYFKEKLSDISTKSLIGVREFMLYTFDDDFWGAPDDKMTPHDITDEYIIQVVMPQMVLFQDDGRAGIICDYEWNDYGLAIKFKPKFEVKPQDDLL